MEEKKKGLGSKSISPERRREIASMGGKAAHATGKAHRWTSESASAAGKKGGAVYAGNSDYMRELGKKGGAARVASRKKEQEEGKE